MFTAKFSRKKAVITLIIFLVIIAALVFLHKDESSIETASLQNRVKDNNQRIEYLNSYGWEVDSEPIETKTVVIPRKFSDVYSDYNKIQQEQGFDLTKYGGIEAVRYTYKILNYPGEENAVADIIVYRNEVIAADVQSVSLDGFMHGLQLPT